MDGRRITMTPLIGAPRCRLCHARLVCPLHAHLGLLAPAHRVDGRPLPTHRSRRLICLRPEVAWAGRELSQAVGAAACRGAEVVPAWPSGASSGGAGSVVYPHSRVSSIAVYLDVERRPSARPVGSEVEHSDPKQDGEGQDHDKTPEVQLSFYPGASEEAAFLRTTA
jgi:hypothetical protein